MAEEIKYLRLKEWKSLLEFRKIGWQLIVGTSTTTTKNGSAKKNEPKRVRERDESTAVPVVRPRLLMLRLKCVLFFIFW